MDNSLELMGIIKNFMIDLHSELAQPPILQPSHIHIIETAASSLKIAQENLTSLQSQTYEAASQREAINDYKKQYQHLEKKMNRRSEEIDILKQTVKTLYADNEKLAKQKHGLAQEIVVLKEQNASLKKKVKRQEEELGNNKSDLQKLTALAEERLNEYLKEDQEKQVRLKRLQAELQKVKAQLGKKQKSLGSMSKKNEQLKGVEVENERLLGMVDTLKYENKVVKSELQSIKENIHSEKVKYLNENQQLLRQIEELNEKEAASSSVEKELTLKWQTEMEKAQSYEEQIVVRTEKLKEKNKQIKAYNQEIEKLARRVKELSQMADEVMDENRELSGKCNALEQRLEEFKTVHSQLGKLSGELSYKKGVELGRMIDYINKLQASL